jgi:hypothetical protein
LSFFDAELVLDRIKARAAERLGQCRGRMGDETIAACWSAILHAADDLDPPLYEAITRSAIDTTRARSNPASKES